MSRLVCPLRLWRKSHTFGTDMAGVDRYRDFRDTGVALGAVGPVARGQSRR
jgi:hypothetical protein